MATSDKKGNNRFENAASREEKNLNIDQILLNIMKDEFPDDPIYRKNKIFLFVINNSVTLYIIIVFYNYIFWFIF